MRQLNLAHKMIPIRDQTPFAQAVPDVFKSEDAVETYRSYYKTKSFAKWEKGRNAPAWWGEG